MKRLRTCRFPAALIAAVLLLTALLSGCGSSSAGQTASMDDLQDSPGNRLQVVATIFPAYDFARHIGGENADVHMLLKPGEEVHSYEPTPQDIRLLQNSDLFIFVGGENDVWVDNIMETLEEKGPAVVRLLDLVDTYGEEQLEGMMPEKGEHDHGSAEPEGEEDHEHSEEGEAHAEDESEGDHEHDHESAESEEDHNRGDSDHGTTYGHEEEADEHVWTSPENCVTLIENLTDAFCVLDPSGEDVYRRNGNAYRDAFEELDTQYREMAASASRKTILFGDRFPFRYLAEELDLTCYAAFAGCSAESEPSAATIAFLIDKAAEEGLPVVFKIEFSNGNIARAVSEAAELRIRKKRKSAALTEKAEEDPQRSGNSSDSSDAEAHGIRVLELHSCQNVTKEEFSSGETCLSLMKRNLEALRTALCE